MKKIIQIGLLICGLFVFAQGEDMKISFEFNDELIITELDDNVAARHFYEMLPLELEFSDYVGKEKISPALKERLNTSGLKGYDPSVGDFFYFAPWGNLGVFYEKQPFHSGLVFLAKIKDYKKFQAQKGDFKVRIKKVL
ncbi:hypothetical protein CQA38_02470 [Campylobacter sp. MIT 12-5580]|uniref:cyclophilin-like fold protein n=1 Tax=Campylobacter sp. MIT 12-5580 TaxID=2040651 RepID=UPI0010F61D35|nr:cyclophilin-like fold protein [Campylobacter sp. MIT 12-5580]TKX29654.1 hypothetical protein CQA38_02470 [Campylobacter sp. MIT 12-5580]